MATRHFAEGATARGIGATAGEFGLALALLLG
jgi:hypothetical protein